MASNRKNLTPSLKQLGLSGGLTGSGQPTNLLGSVSASSTTPSLSVGSSRESKTLSASGADRQATSINFGKAHIPKTKATTSSWSTLVKQVASGGLFSALGLGGSLMSENGIKQLVTGIEGLFGGSKSTPPPLVAFQLPASQNQTITIGGQNTGSSLQDHSAAVAQAVKTAMLQSSSLNDVIAEI